MNNIIPDIQSDCIDFVLFTIDNLLFALRIEDVQEIKRVTQINHIYNAPEYVCGVVNLRGQIVTVIDLSKRLNYFDSKINEKSRLIVVKRGDEQIGLLVESIEDAIRASSLDILVPPPNIHGIENRFFTGIYKTSESLVTILNLKTILEKDEKQK